jgi:hypothetical protein
MSSSLYNESKKKRNRLSKESLSINNNSSNNNSSKADSSMVDEDNSFESKEEIQTILSPKTSSSDQSKRVKKGNSFTMNTSSSTILEKNSAFVSEGNYSYQSGFGGYFQVIIYNYIALLSICF